MRSPTEIRLVFAIVLLTATIAGGTCLAVPKLETAAQPGSRVVMDAHNCYPYFGWWPDRIDRALSAGTPLAIEQDLLWVRDPKTGGERSLVTHGAPFTGAEPSMREHFFERVRPVIEKALKEGNRNKWPLITLNLDFKSEEPEHLADVWRLLDEYRAWITTAKRTADIHRMSPLDVRPILVLTGDSEAQKGVFYDRVAVGDNLLVFGAAHSPTEVPSAPPERLVPEGGDNYHRWWNNAWRVVEAEGQTKAGEWTEEKGRRLKDLVRYAHEKGLWIRFYTLDGVSVADESCRGIFHTYNFGSRDAVEKRWRAAAEAGADYIATDQYEELAKILRKSGGND